MQVVTESDVLNSDSIKEGLHTRILGKEVYCFRETDSTQTVAQALANRGVGEGTVVLAEGQARGKGRMGRSWFSPPGEGIWASLILRPPISPSQAGRVSLTAALAVAEAIRTIAGLPALIKWPNDILINDKKAGGILLEISAEMDRVKFIILGIGINVNQDKFPGELKGKATSLKKEKGKEISRLSLLQEVLRRFDNYYFSLKGGSFEGITDRWRKLSATLERQIRVSCQGEIMEGLATAIDSDGALLLRLDSGFVKRLVGGEVRVISDE